MKNIFILPAKSFKSKLAIYFNKEYTELHEVGELAFCKDDIGWSDFWRPQELYITSEEALKPGDWYINTSLDLSQQAPEIHAKKSDFVAHKKDPLFKYCKKIFLTTDPVLGIKEVPDTFLEYLVKHPLCDEIKITFEESCCGKCDGVNNICFADMVCEKHKVQCEKCATELVKEVTEETAVEKAAMEHLAFWRSRNNAHLNNPIHAERCKNDYKSGVTWQKTRSYTYEEMKESFSRGHDSARLKGSYKSNESFEEDWEIWSNQFKKE